MSTNFAELDFESLLPDEGYVIRGGTVTAAGDVNGDGFDDLLRYGDYLKRNDNAGRVDLILGEAGPHEDVVFTNTTPPGPTTLLGRDLYSFITLGGIGDINADGLDDFVIAAPNINPESGDNFNGRVFVIYGTAAPGPVDLDKVPKAQGFSFYGATSDHMGVGFANIGDFNGDGRDDLLFGTQSGAYLLWGRANMGPVDVKALTPSVGITIKGNAPGYLGARLCPIGDMNGDGFADFAMAAPEFGQEEGGAKVFIVFGHGGTQANLDMDFMSPTQGIQIFGQADLSQLGQSLSGPGDLNGDGLDDLIIGDPSTQRIYCLYGKVTGLSNMNIRDFGRDDGFVIKGYSGLSTSDNVALVGDLNSDGFRDLVVASEIVDGGGQTQRVVTCIWGREEGFSGLDLQTLTPQQGTRWFPTQFNQFAGMKISDAGDVNGDGFDDLLIGSDNKTYVIFGSRPYDPVDRLGSDQAEILYGSDFADTLQGLAGDDTLDGGDGADRLVGGAGADLMRGGAGNDTYVDIGTGDILVELRDGGVDTVIFATSHALQENVENLILVGTGRVSGLGNSSDNHLTGNAGRNLLKGLGGNDTLDGQAGTDTMLGGAGNDTYIVDDLGDVFTELANGGTDTVVIGRSWDISGNFENVTLTGTANLLSHGTDGANFMRGNDGVDTLYGFDGNDFLVAAKGGGDYYGGLGNDVYEISGRQQIVHESAGAGLDLVEASISYRLGANVENLGLLGALGLAGIGNALNNALSGSGGNDRLAGMNGNDSFYGGEGVDTLQGGPGNDLYWAMAEDVIVEKVGDGTADTVLVQSDHVLGQGVEVEILSAAYGGASQTLNLTGNGLAQMITGNAGTNTLSDGGSAAADTLVGLGGDDTYLVNNSGALIVEGTGQGVDRVVTTVSFVLAADDSIEELTASVPGSKVAIDLTGTAGAQIITGNAGANGLLALGGDDTLAGGGGLDTLQGGTGSDTYFVTDDRVVIVEGVGAGNDTVFSEVSLTLAANVETLVLTGAAEEATGNGGANTLIGTNADNWLYGLDGKDLLQGHADNDWLDGGAGIDTLDGGTGDDVYVVDDPADVIAEVSNGGTDEIQAWANYSMAGWVERLFLMGGANLNATGSDSGDLIVGNSGANRLTGLGGADTLDGGAGSDTMEGGFGDDIYFIDATDVLTEIAGQGDFDGVSTQFSHVLKAEFEGLFLGGTAAINGTGNSAGNGLFGNTAANVLSGGIGLDYLDGDAGNDQLYGGTESDTLLGGLGTDRLYGGDGGDYFIFDEVAESRTGTARDVILDFRTDDYVSLEGISAESSYQLVFIGSSAFSAGFQVRFAGGILSGDSDGDRTVDFEIQLSGVSTIAASHLLL